MEEALNRKLRVCAGLKSVRLFIIAAGWRSGANDRADLRVQLAP